MGTRKTVCQLINAAWKEVEDAGRLSAGHSDPDHMIEHELSFTARSVHQHLTEAWTYLQQRLSNAADPNRRQVMIGLFQRRLGRLKRHIEGTPRFNRFPEARRRLLDVLELGGYNEAPTPTLSDLELLEI